MPELERLDNGDSDAALDASRANGLVIYRASRLEALIPPLAMLLDASWPDNLLEPQTIVAAHPGMKQWLLGALARHDGPSGIAANLDIILPSAWIDRLASEALGEHAVSLPRYRRMHLRWTLHDMLAPGHAVDGVTDPRIEAYLAAAADGDPLRAGGPARRRFQLADRLALIYSQYLVYRPDWLRAWEAGQFRYASGARGEALSGLEAQLLGPLWRQVASRLGRHRAQALEGLHSALRAGALARRTLHVFGVTHLAPAEVRILRAYAEHGMVALYVPDPCREFWGGLVGRDSDDGLASRARWDAYRNEEEARIDAAGEGDYWSDQGHPLLARWGRMGQHFFSALAEGDVREDIRHWQDERPAAPVTRLQRLQESIRQLNPQLLRIDLADARVVASEMADTSLRIHSCHTRLRELEVLHDALLDAMATGVQPGEMIVMTPDIQAYLPLIPAVFGAPGDARVALPYHLADAPVARSHGLFTTFLRLLDLPRQRITAAEMVDLLSVPEIQRRFGMDTDDVDDLVEWMRQSRVAWALDGEHRAHFGVPPIAEHTFAWAMDRMIAGYLMSDAPAADRDRAFVFPDETELAPVTGIQGPSAEAVGALDRLLQCVQSLVELSGETHAASAWADRLDRQLDALFKIDPWDKEAREAWDTLHRFVRAIETEPHAAGLDPELHFSVVRDLLVAGIGAVPDRQRFLMGGITFCGMVPQRAIPFRMVAVLGLNDGEFPRNASDAGLDLMTRIRRIGDRDVRSDDRYLFLETIMSARDRLHLGFVGLGVKDGKPRSPAAPLAELLGELDAAAAIAPDANEANRPWLVIHPLQPFDARYFDGKDQRLFSYDQRYRSMHGTGREAQKPFLSGSSGEPDALPDPLALAAIVDYYKDPARNVLEKRAKLHLDALDQDRLGEDEPLDGTLDRLSTVARKVFFKDVLPTWPEGAWRPNAIPSWVRLTGLLPPGRLGDAAWRKELDAIDAAMTAARATATLDGDVASQARVESVDVEIVDGSFEPPIALRVTGRIHNVFPLDTGEAEGLQLLRVFPTVGEEKGRLKAESDLHFGERVSIFLDWALLRLQTARRRGAEVPLGSVLVTLLTSGNDEPWQAGFRQWDERLLRADASRRQTLLDDLQSRVAKLIHWWREAQRRPHWYFARTSWKAVTAAKMKDDAQADASQPDAGDPACVKAVQNAWSGFGERGERGYGTGYNHLLVGDVAFDAGSPELQRLLEFAMDLHDAISFHGSAQP